MERYRSKVLISDRRWLLNPRLPGCRGRVALKEPEELCQQQMLGGRLGHCPVSRGGRLGKHCEFYTSCGDHQVHSPVFVCEPSFPFVVWALKASLYLLPK